MKIVIQCARRKFENAGRLAALSGESDLFVVYPERYTLQDKCCRPDDKKEDIGFSWRDFLKSYNQKGSNPNNFFPAEICTRKTKKYVELFN